MQRTGTKLIRIMTWIRGDASPEHWKAEVFRRISQLLKMAEDGGVALAHENCTGWASESPAETIELLDTFRSPALVALYDTANPLAYGKDTRAFLRALKHRAAYVHVKDWKMGPDGKGGHGTYPGEGDSLLREQLAEIFGTGYDGVVSIEPHVASIIHEAKESADPDAAYNVYVEFGRRLMKLVHEVRADVLRGRDVLRG